jgi:hypothetical protein
MKGVSSDRNERVYERGLVILAARKHDDVGRRGLGSNGFLMGGVSLSGFLEEPHDVVGDAGQIALAVGRDSVQEPLASLLGKVGLLYDALRRVDVGEVESCARVARVEDGSEAHACLEGPDHDSVHFVVCDMAVLAEIDRIDDFVVAVGLVAVEILCLPSMA